MSLLGARQHKNRLQDDVVSSLEELLALRSQVAYRMKLPFDDLHHQRFLLLAIRLEIRSL